MSSPPLPGTAAGRSTSLKRSNSRNSRGKSRPPIADERVPSKPSSSRAGSVSNTDEGSTHLRYPEARSPYALDLPSSFSAASSTGARTPEAQSDRQRSKSREVDGSDFDSSSSRPQRSPVSSLAPEPRLSGDATRLSSQGQSPRHSLSDGHQQQQSRRVSVAEIKRNVAQKAVQPQSSFTLSASGGDIGESPIRRSSTSNSLMVPRPALANASADEEIGETGLEDLDQPRVKSRRLSVMDFLAASPRASNSNSLMVPRSPVIGSDVNAEGEEVEAMGIDESRSKAQPSRRLSMMDFLAAGSPPEASIAETLGPAELLSLSLSNRSVGLGGPSRSPSSMGNLRSSRPRPVSMMVSSPSRIRAREGEGTTLHDDTATLSRSETLRNSLRRLDPGAEPASLHDESNKALPSPRDRRPQPKGSVSEVQLSIVPVTDVMTMFGSTQTSANYSLSGTVIAVLPRPRAGGPQVTVKTLSIVFSGYSIYADLSGRYSGIRLCEIKQDLLPAGATLPLEADLGRGSDDGSPIDDSSELRYELQFDVNVPGWLPGSAHSRFGATFYCLSASAVVLDGAGTRTMLDPRLMGGESDSMDDVFSQSPVDGRLRPLSVSPNMHSAEVNGTRSTSPVSHYPSGSSMPPPNPIEFGALPGDQVDAGGSSRSRVMQGWLSKRAKQLSLKSKSGEPPNPSEESNPRVIFPSGSMLSKVVSGKQSLPALDPRHDRPGRERQRDGTLLVKSDKQLIVLRRCRDVVPVPVARMAIVGMSPAAAQDHTASQSSLPKMSTAGSAAARERPSQRIPDGLSLPHGSSSNDDPARLQPAMARSQSTQSQASSTGSAHTALETPVDEAGISSAASPRLPTEETASVPTPPSQQQSSTVDTVTMAHSTSTDTTAGATPRSHLGPLPVAPSALDAPTDPAKLAATSRIPAAPIRTSSAMTNDPEPVDPVSDSGSQRPGGPPAMRHFLHRPVLHPPLDSGIEEGEGLPFSLTISVPSHVQVQTADVLTFGVQVEVGRTSGWSQVRQLGGLRLRDMELICQQTERHTSVPSRTFCHTFPVPTEPKIVASDLPVLPPFSSPINNREVASSHELRVRAGYDSNTVTTHLAMLDAGHTLQPEENDVERVRNSVVGPPPNFQQQRQPRDAGGKGKAKEGSSKDKRGPNGISRGRPMNGQQGSSRPSLFADNGQASQQRASNGNLSGAAAITTTTNGGRIGPGSGPSNGSTIGAAMVPSPSRSHLTPNTAGSGSGVSSAIDVVGSVTAGSSNHRASLTAPTSPDPRQQHLSGSISDSLLAPVSAGHQSGESTSPGDFSSNNSRRSGGRGRRAYEATLRGLSAFATAMMDVGDDVAMAGQWGQNGGPASGHHVRNADAQGDQDQARATYSFAGEDGHGVDLTKGRIRMTVNLPLVSASASAARREKTPQLVPDYESPHMRVRHKLKVKLGFGFGAKPLGGDGEWGQALVMCVPVRFTDAPPREVREQFAPMPVTLMAPTLSQGQAGAGPTIVDLVQPIISVDQSTSTPQAHSPHPPVLPAYTQLFRDDGSRLNEAEDLPAYPGPSTARNASATHGITTLSTSSRPRSIRMPSMPHRGSVTGPMTPRIASASSGVGNASMDSTTAASTAQNGATQQGGGGSIDTTMSEGIEAPLSNALAPERVVDDAIRGITDPDESLAAIREQEREMRELEDDIEEREVEAAAGGRAAGLDLVDEEDDEDDDEGDANEQSSDGNLSDKDQRRQATVAGSLQPVLLHSENFGDSNSSAEHTSSGPRRRGYEEETVVVDDSAERDDGLYD